MNIKNKLFYILNYSTQLIFKTLKNSSGMMASHNLDISSNLFNPKYVLRS